MRATEEFFEANPVFTLDTFRAVVAAGGARRAAYLRLQYYVTAGRLKRLRSGLFAVVPRGVDPGVFVPDPYLTAAVLADADPLGYHTAVELLGLGHSAFRRVTVASTRRRPPVQLGPYEVVFELVPKAIRDSRPRASFTTTVDRGASRLTITDRERTTVDCLVQPDRAGGLEEVISSLSGLGVLDLDHLQEYLRLMNMRRAWAVVGWFLETYSDRLFVSERLLASLERRRPKSPTYWVSGERTGSLSSRWNLIVPQDAQRVAG